MIGMFIIAIPTARHADTAATLNVAKAPEAMPANVADAVPPVTRESTHAPRAFIPESSPTVAKRTTAAVARVMFPRNPIDTICPVRSSAFMKSNW